MSKTKTQKQDIAKGLTKDLDAQKSLVFVDYKGIGVKDLAALRTQLKGVGAKFQVAKKTLLQRVFKEKGVEVNPRELEGQLALIFSFEDPVAGAKAANTFAKTNEKLRLIGGYFENQVMDEAQVKELALIPSREELLGRLVGSIASPMSGFMNVLQGNIKGLVVALSAIQEKKA